MKFSKKISVLAMCSLFFVVVPFCAYAGLSDCAKKVWDIDKNGEALVEGQDCLMIIKYLMGATGSNLVKDVIADDATTKDSSLITSYLTTLKDTDILDVDGNGVAEAFADGLLLMRYAYGYRGTELTNEAIASDATRTPDEIIAYIENIEDYHLNINPCATRNLTDYAKTVWDIDDNGEALVGGQDCLMIIRYLMGSTGFNLVKEAIADDAMRTTEDIEDRLEELTNKGILDVDGNGVADALSDGILLMRYAYGYRGTELTNAAVASDATRTTPDEIIAYIEMGGLPDCTSTENLSLDPLATATQSSDYGGNPDSDDARDGSRSSYNHTNRESQPWWQIDLGSSAYIEYINLYNRSSNPERLKNFKIFVSETPFKTPSGDDMTMDDIENGNICSWTEFVPGVIDNNNPEDYNVGEYGRYVRIQLTGTNYLNITEVEIYGCR